MVKIISRTVKGNLYYYLSHSFRDGRKVLHIEKYLGNKLPKIEELDHIKEDFLYEIFQKRWEITITKITNKYRERLESIPKPIQTKDLRAFGVHFTHNTNRIEGSSLTLREVDLVINEPNIPINKPANDVIEAKSHMSVYEEMLACNREIDWELILDWHEKLFELTKPEIAGIVRSFPVKIVGSKFNPPESRIEYLLDDLLEWYKIKKNKFHPVFLACIMHFRFVSIHPFGDGNGRMCRILMNYILHKHKYPMFDIEYKIRQGYYKALENSNLKEDEAIFINWFFTRYIKASSIYL